MENKNKPAFPIVDSEGIAISIASLEVFSPDGAKGITKREYFAAMAMQGILAKNYGSNFSTSDLVAEHSLKFADAICTLLEIDNDSDHGK